MAAVNISVDKCQAMREGKESQLYMHSSYLVLLNVPLSTHERDLEIVSPGSLKTSLQYPALFRMSNQLLGILGKAENIIIL